MPYEPEVIIKANLQKTPLEREIILRKTLENIELIAKNYSCKDALEVIQEIATVALNPC